MTPQQIKYYKKLKTDMLMEAAGEEVSAVNAAVKLSKLLQIACGSVYTDTGEVVDFDASNRLHAVKEVIDEASHKVLVFVPFTHTILQVNLYLLKHGISSAIINGEVPVHTRTEIVKRFQEADDIRVLIIQPQAASHGLTLTAADTVVWYAPVTSVETYLQANARIDRPGQKNAMTVVHIKGSPIEARLYQLLRSNISNHEKIIELYKQELSEGT
jgi:SNF2 family DNA or RNA helicase